MDFGFSEEQELLRQEVRKLLDEHCPMPEVRRIMEAEPGMSPELWRRMAELGWLGLIVPEEHGGAGLGWVDLIVVLEETGRSLLPAPLLSTALASAAIAELGSEAQRARWLPRLADGGAIGSIAMLEGPDLPGPRDIALAGELDGEGYRLSGRKRFVMDAGTATLFVVPFRTGSGPDDLSIAVLERSAEGLRVETHPTVDRTKRLGSVWLEGARVGRDALLGAAGGAGPAIERLGDLGAVAVTAEMIGAAEAAHVATVRYARDRLQFGNPIGRYQGVKHPLADLYVDLESARSLLYYAAWAADQSPAELPAAASRAKAYATETFSRVGIDAVQLHGAVGYTAELDVQLYLKRSQWARPAFGDADHHYERLAALGGL